MPIPRIGHRFAPSDFKNFSMRDFYTNIPLPMELQANIGYINVNIPMPILNEGITSLCAYFAAIGSKR